MKKALAQAEKALEAGEFPVGCVIAHKGEVIADGIRQGTGDRRHRETDHAEILALKKLQDLDADPDFSGLTVYATMEPCLMCFGAILIHGITKIVYAYEDAMGGGTGCDLSSFAPLYREKKLEITPHILRAESLRLFKTFFSNPKNDYWPESLLEKYTLAQDV